MTEKTKKEKLAASVLCWLDMDECQDELTLTNADLQNLTCADLLKRIETYKKEHEMCIKRIERIESVLKNHFQLEGILSSSK